MNTLACPHAGQYVLRGPRVRALLGRSHLSVTEGAQKLCISRTYFSQLLAGTRALSPKVRRRLLETEPFRALAPTELWREPPLTEGDDSPPRPPEPKAA
ncbi:MAG: helix-turn-helix transcriptional regulator [Myxococcota bacterium]